MNYQIELTKVAHDGIQKLKKSGDLAAIKKLNRIFDELREHPEMESFMLSPDCALLRVIAQSFQVVYGIDDIRWLTSDDLDST